MQAMLDGQHRQQQSRLPTRRRCHLHTVDLKPQHPQQPDPQTSQDNPNSSPSAVGDIAREQALVIERFHVYFAPF
ncbi:MAG: hypothetical protein ACR2H2_12435 [Solirubrobacteraceae bacterium]